MTKRPFHCKNVCFKMIKIFSNSINMVHLKLGHQLWEQMVSRHQLKVEGLRCKNMSSNRFREFKIMLIWKKSSIMRDRVISQLLFRHLINNLWNKLEQTFKTQQVRKVTLVQVNLRLDIADNSATDQTPNKWPNQVSTWNPNAQIACKVANLQLKTTLDPTY